VFARDGERVCLLHSNESACFSATESAVVDGDKHTAPQSNMPVTLWCRMLVTIKDAAHGVKMTGAGHDRPSNLCPCTGLRARALCRSEAY
jgi:hypothetical protein